MLGNVSQRVLDAVFARLSDPGTGFNAGIAINALNYNLDPNFIKIDWTTTSQNFYFDQIDSEILEKSGTITYPFACLYIAEAAHTGEQRFTQFSGLINCIFEINLSWVPIRGTQNREAYSNCIEDVVLDVINRVENQNWGKPLVYNGGIKARRGATIMGAQNYKKKIAFSMIFGLHQ